jgi:hypothetical protein
MGKWCTFQRREDGPAKPGDIFDINISGDAGSVVIKDTAPDHFTVATVNGEPYGEHPIYGTRRFGWSPARAAQHVAEVWEPNEVWREFLTAHLAG